MGECGKGGKLFKDASTANVVGVIKAKSGEYLRHKQAIERIAWYRKEKMFFEQIVSELKNNSRATVKKSRTGVI